MMPNDAADPWSTDVRKLGRSAVVISCPESEKKLAAPTLPTPAVSQV
jgi:hypothetical protein